MQFGDLHHAERGSRVLICTKDTSKEEIKDWNGRTVGTHGHALDYRVDPNVGIIDKGYREEITSHKDGASRKAFKLSTFVYLHGTGLERCRVNAKAPLMSVAFHLGAKEIHTKKVEDEAYADELRARGVKIVLLSGKAEAPAPEPEKTVEPEKVAEPTNTTGPVKKAKDKPKKKAKKKKRKKPAKKKK